MTARRHPTSMQLGEESSVWFKLTPLLKGPEQPADAS